MQHVKQDNEIKSDTPQGLDHRRNVKLTKKVVEDDKEGQVYGNVSNREGDLKSAERLVNIAKEVGDKAGEGGAYGNLGNAYNS